MREKKRPYRKDSVAEETHGYQCIWNPLNENPKCPHGPTLLFGHHLDGEYKQFYACSACRDRKLCSFYLEYGSKPTKQQKEAWELETKRVLPRYDHSKMFIRLHEMLAENSSRRIFCHDCSRLSFVTEAHKHRGHDVVENLTDIQLSRPTELLKPLDNAKKEAQFLFSEKSTKEITNMLLAIGAKNILCIGTPRIHEFIVNNLDTQMSSLLLDFDGRFHNFFGPLSYCWYNLFNHHFFNDDAKEVFKDFLTQNGGKDMYLICDPPFGGRVEPMSKTMKTISELHAKLNSIQDESDRLKILFILPYYMEPTLKEKSNPPGILGGLRELAMCDYKVEYDNHPLFAKSEQRKIGSPVRIFTNIDLNLLALPESEGYKYCKRCKKWTSAENKHCKICKDCTSKDGRRYRHCKTCERCVKPTWKHCSKCQRCALETHTCGEAPKITGQCYKCREFGHIAKNCNNSNEVPRSDSKSDSITDTRKRKNKDETQDVDSKKIKVATTNQTLHEPTKKSKPKKAKLTAFGEENNTSTKSKRIDIESRGVEKDKSVSKLKTKLGGKKNELQNNSNSTKTSTLKTSSKPNIKKRTANSTNGSLDIESDEFSALENTPDDSIMITESNKLKGPSSRNIPRN